MSAKAIKRTGREPSRALVTAANAQARHGMSLSSAQCAQLELTLDVRRETETLAQAATRL
ncbi:MAG TPA: hypothetical protein VLS88_00795 [Polyangiales bacterium]|nr:hypothetical protein [Polyangiales bacterium]